MSPRDSYLCAIVMHGASHPCAAGLDLQSRSALETKGRNCGGKDEWPSLKAFTVTGATADLHGGPAAVPRAKLIYLLV